MRIQYGTTTKKDAELVFAMLKPSDSLKVLLFLGKVIGGAVGTAISAFTQGDSGAFDNLDPGKLGDAIPVILDRIDEGETLQKVNIILSSVSHQGTALEMDYFIFDGRPDLFFKILKEAITVNYQFFFQESEGLFQKLEASKKAILDSLAQSKTQA